MDRARQVGSLWNYLPTFRAVAELESASAAARALGLTPSAISRSVAALEARVGQPLFRRAGRQLVLNDAGEHLLLAVRTAMRGVDDGLQVLRGGALVGPLRVSASEPFASSVMPALAAELLAAHPGLVPVISADPPDRVAHALTEGTIDLALTSGIVGRRPADLAVRSLGQARTGIYGRRGHPVFARKTPPPAAFASFEFVAATGDAALWPADVQRTVRAQAHDVRTAAMIAEATELLVVLADAYAASAHPGLVRVSSNVPRPLPVFAVWRRSLGGTNRTEVALEVVTRLLGRWLAA